MSGPRTDLLDFLALEHFKPLRVVLDAQRRLVSQTGDQQYYGYPDWHIGADIGEALPFLHGLSEREPIEIPYLETPNGRSATAYVEPRDDGLRVLMVDATEARDRQQALQQKSNELALLAAQQQRLTEQLREVNEELVQRRAEAEAASRSKSRFIATMSHEFRTPLTAILGHLDLLARRGQDHAPGGIKAIDRAAKHLLGLVENLLEQAQLEIGESRINREPTEVVALLDELHAYFAPICAAQGLAFQLEIAPRLPAVLELDGLRMRQILINVLGNACKYTDRGSVKLRADWHDGQLALAVVDTGPGMDEKTREKLFVPFHRADGVTQSGAGLGLSISQRLLDKMRGGIDVASETGAGTTVTVTLPARSVAAAETGEPSRGGQDQPATVLLVEDDRDVYEIMLVYLESAGFAVAHESRGASARTYCRVHEPQVVILDLNLPDTDGFELAAALRSDGFSNAVIMLTASSLHSDRVRALDSGCDDYLLKPIMPAELIRVIGKHTKSNRRDVA